MISQIRYDINQVKNLILTESVNNSFEENRKIIRFYIKNLFKSNEYENGNRVEDDGYSYNVYNLWVTFLTFLHNSLHIEEKLHDEFKLANKEINKFLDLRKTNDFSEIIQLCQKYYSPYSEVRFGLETMDSIEEVRLYMEELSDNGINIYSKVYVKL